MFSGQHFAILAMFWRLVLVSCSSSLGLCLLVLYLCLVLLDWVSGFWFSCFCVLALWLLCLGHSDLTPAPFRWRLSGDLPGGWLPPPHLQGQGRLQGRQPGQRQHEAAPQVRRKGHPSSPPFFFFHLFFSFFLNSLLTLLFLLRTVHPEAFLELEKEQEAAKTKVPTIQDLNDETVRGTKSLYSARTKASRAELLTKVNDWMSSWRCEFLSVA